MGIKYLENHSRILNDGRIEELYTSRVFHFENESNACHLRSSKKEQMLRLSCE